jgi:predicted RNase H-like HicB family nuclease
MAINKGDDGYSVSCTNLTGCCTGSEKEILAIKNIETAIKDYLDNIGNNGKNNQQIKLIKVEVTL